MDKNIFYIDNAVSFKEITQDEDNAIIITGYPSTPDIDRQQEIIDPSAFEKSIDLYLRASGSIFYNHDWDNAVGKIISYTPPSGDKGFEISAKIYPDIDEKVYKRVKYGIVKSFSVGFRINEYQNEIIENKNIFVIKNADLWDISIVSVPANPYANFAVIKSLVKYIGKDKMMEIMNEEFDGKLAENKIPETANDDEFISVKKCEMDRLLKSVDDVVSYFIRLIDKLSLEQRKEFYKMISDVKNIKN